MQPATKQSAARRKSPASRLHRFLGYSLLGQFESMSELYWLLKSRMYYRRFFGAIGERSKILDPMRLTNVHNVFVGDDVMINRHAFLLTLALPDKPKPRLSIGDGSVIGHMNHITCVEQVTIGKKVLTADRVHISDNSHIFEDPTIAILDQGVRSGGTVTIGDGSWIGENASLISCHIGKHCVIGSNAVVVTDIPDYCVAVGTPARVVRRYDPLSRQWIRTSVAGSNIQTTDDIRMSRQTLPSARQH
jgi:acetyltransferase-like isoleucine patch superfamily enzyme